jgi:hypothetical protein
MPMFTENLRIERSKAVNRGDGGRIERRKKKRY